MIEAGKIRPWSRAIGAATALLAPLAVAAYLHPPDGRSRADWVQWLGRFHILVVHWPVCLIAVAPVFELLGWSRRRPDLRAIAVLLLEWGAIAAIAAVLFGGLLAYAGGYAGAGVVRHLWGGLALAFLCAGALQLRPFALRPGARWAAAGYAVVLALTVGTMIWTAHQGGALTHGAGFLTEKMPPRWKKALRISGAALASAEHLPAGSAYAQQVQPIFDQHCTVCHGPDKIKGKLRLDRFEFLHKGGEHGPVAVGGDGARSELLRRITLAPDDKKFMPSDGKPPLSEMEVAVIRQWIAGGASPSATSADLAARGFPMPAAGPLPPAVRVTADYRPRVAALSALQRKLGLRLIPISQNPTDGLILRTISDPGRVNDETLVQLLPAADLIVDAELAGTRVTDRALATLARYENLRRLDLAGTKVTSANLPVLKPLRHLEWLSLVNTQVDASGAAVLRSWPNLKTIHLYGSKAEQP